MNSETRKINFANLISEFNQFKRQGKLDLSSEETIRTWLNPFLSIFGWDVRDTSQILQEKVLSKEEKEKLKTIGSTNTKPDYTFKLAKQKLTFLDAKDISVNIREDSDAAFQIKSYGWSILAPCSFISNFEEFAIYDCTYIPNQSQAVTLGRIYFTIDEYIDNFEIIEKHLLKENVYNGVLNELYSESLSGNKYVEKISPDLKFAEELSNFRLALASDILKNNSSFIGKNSGNLSYVVQVLINRILFVRVCEARNIEEDGLLLSYQERGFWDTFKNSSYFEFFEHYDGPLFNRVKEIHDLKISDEVFNNLISYLYYPSPYRFEVIPTKLLSDIYEIFLAKKLIIIDKKVIEELKNEYLKTKGAVSTPQYIVQDIIKRTILKSQLLRDGIENLFSKKILDIACGSGVFLIEAYDYMEEILKELFIVTNHPNFKKYFTEVGENIVVNLLGKKTIMDNCIFGVDIDPEAVEVARMSLSLKIVEANDLQESYHEIGMFGSKILNGIGSNILCGNSLVEPDILDLCPSLEKNEDEMLRTNIFEWKSEISFKRIFDENGGFDFIIGNPPYVEVKNYNVDLPCMHFYIKHKFISTINGKIDLSIPFIEKALALLNDSGRVGFIVQKRFFKTVYGKNIRDIISANNYLLSIIDFETNSIFKDRITYVALLLLDKSSQDSFSFKFFNESIAQLPSKLRETQTPDIAPEDYSIFSAKSVSSNPWNFNDSELIEISNKLLELGKFGDFAKVRVGIQALWDKAYHIKPFIVRKGIIEGESHIEKNLLIELEACRPLICNEKFYPYRADMADVFVIFPYDVVEGKVNEIPFSEFNKRFPLAGGYLTRNKKLIQQNVKTENDPNKWHFYTRKQNHGATYPKILVPMTARDTFASLTFSKTTYCDNANVFFIDSPSKDETSLFALSAIINSSIYSVLARSIANPQSNGYFKFNKQFLEPVPFPIENFNSDAGLKRKLADVAKKIAATQSKHILASPTQKKSFAKILFRYWQELDELCNKMYNLNDAEKQFFQKRGRNVNRVDILN